MARRGPAGGVDDIAYPSVGRLGEPLLQRCARVAVGRAALRPRRSALRRRRVPRLDRRVRRVRRDRALAGVPDHRHRRAHPVRLLPRRPRWPTWSPAFQRRGIEVFVDYNPWDTTTGDADDHPALAAARRRPRRRRSVPRHDERRRRDARARRSRRCARPTRARGRVADLARTDRRPPAQLGAVVRRQRRPPG